MPLTDYHYYKKITIDSSKIASDLSHFPVPIPLGSAVGLTDTDVTDIFTEVGSDYLKIAVFMADETTQLYVEVEQWDATNNKGLLWVSRDTWTVLAASDVDIYLAFDSTTTDNTTYVGQAGDLAAQNVWNSNFEAVWTMAQDPTGGADCIIDSTGNGNHATPQGSMVSGDLVDGQIGLALNFDGSKYLSLTSINLLQTYTVLYTNKPAALICITPGDTGGSYYTAEYSEDFYHKATTNSDMNWSYSFSVGTWYNIAVQRNEGIADLFVDGVAQGELGADSDYCVQAIASYNGVPYAQTIQRLFLATVELSDAWLKADDEAQADNLLTFTEPPTHEILGTVSEDGSYVSRTVRLHKRSDGSLVDEVVSSSIDGTFSFILYDGTTEYYVVALDDTSDATDYNALIYDRVTGVAI